MSSRFFMARGPSERKHDAEAEEADESGTEQVQLENDLGLARAESEILSSSTEDGLFREPTGPGDRT